MKVKCIILVLLLSIPLLNINYPIHAQDLSYESDIEYILTKYLLEDYQEVLRLLNKHFSEKQKELGYLYGLCYLKLNMNRIAIDYFNNTLTEHENNYEVLNNIGVAYFNENAMKYYHLFQIQIM